MTGRETWRYIHDREGKPIVVNFQDFECNIIMERYQKGGLSIRLIDINDRSSICRATSRLADVGPRSNELFIKDYAENDGVLQSLIDAGLVSDTGKIVDTGHVQLNVCEMSLLLAAQWKTFQRELTNAPDQSFRHER